MAKKLSFEEAMAKIETIVQNMENSGIDLDKSLKQFEEGIELIRFCSGKLAETKKKVEILVKKNGKLVPEGFEEADDK